MKILILGLCLMLAACGERVEAPKGFSCGINECKKGVEAFRDICDKEKLAKFIVECARAANPMSDEEGEDLVRECGSQGKVIFCEREYVLLK